MCRPTGIMKHVISYYNYKSTNVNVYKLDTTKVFDRVHYGQLFRILQKINLPAIMLRLLLDMYTRQSTATILFVCTLMNCFLELGNLVMDVILVIYRMLHSATPMM